MRRTPLFGYDGNLGIPIIPPKPKVTTATQPTSTSKKNNSKLGSYNSHHNKGSTSSTSSVGSTSSNSSMEVSTRNGLNGKATPTCSSATPGTPNKHVNFGGSGASEEKKREKFLTAKYGAHQMALIRKRLRVEMWMYERLQEIYGADDIEIDLDEVLDMDDETERRTYISELLRVGCKRPLKVEHVNLFVGDLLEKVKTL